MCDNILVKTTLTAKLKLRPRQTSRCPPANPTGLPNALNLVSAYAFAHGKTSDSKRLQHDTYADTRQFGLPSQMACNVPRQVGATYKALWTRAQEECGSPPLGYTKSASRAWIGPPLRLAHPHLRLWAGLLA